MGQGRARLWRSARCVAGSVLLLAGCSSSSGRAGDGAPSSDSGFDPRLDGVPVNQQLDLSNVKMCTSSEDCSGGAVCHPYAHFCDVPGDACGGQTECGAGTYCESTLGVCLPGTTGSPCERDENCNGSCVGGFCGCDGLVQEQKLTSVPLDVYLVLDRTASMVQPGRDCAYQHGTAPPESSKACYATYALCDYLIDVQPAVETRLAFQFMSQDKACDGASYETPLHDLTPLPVSADAPIVRTISDETFGGGNGTRIEGALKGLAAYTTAHATPGREIVGVLLTDGDPSGCEEGIPELRKIIANHLAATGIRTFIIGMEGATLSNLERLAEAGGAAPHSDFCGGVDKPCHYWNVGDGSGNALASALQAIVQMAVPLPCSFEVAGLKAPPDEALDFAKVNVTLTQGEATTTIGQVLDQTACPGDQPAWYYDNPAAPTQIHLCPQACTLVSEAGDGARVSAVVGCQTTVTLY